MSRRVAEVITEIDNVTAAAAEIRKAHAITGLLGCYTGVSDEELETWRVLAAELAHTRAEYTDALALLTSGNN